MSFEGKFPVKHLVENHSDGPQIRLVVVGDLVGIGLHVNKDFVSHGLQRANLRLGDVIALLGIAELANNHPLLVVEDVGERNVSVEDFLLSQGQEAVEDLLEESHCVTFLESLLFIQDVLEVPVLTEISDQIVVVFGLEEIVEMHDVLVLDGMHDDYLRAEELF